MRVIRYHCRFPGQVIEFPHLGHVQSPAGCEPGQSPCFEQRNLEYQRPPVINSAIVLLKSLSSAFGGNSAVVLNI